MNALRVDGIDDSEQKTSNEHMSSSQQFQKKLVKLVRNRKSASDSKLNRYLLVN